MTNNIIHYKKIIMQLEKGKSARHIIFTIELRKSRAARDFDTLEEIAEPLELAICGADSLRGCCCQMRGSILNYADRVKTQDIKPFFTICNLWELYHLNTMHAGTKKQEQFLKENKLTHADYNERCAALEKVGLLFDRGYKYGSDWLVEQLSSGIVNLLKSI